MIPYGKQSINEEDIAAVIKCLKGDFLTTGPLVSEFENAITKYTGAKYAVAVSNGTAALHLACLAAGLSSGDELITSPITFAASANCARYCGAIPRFADVDFNLLIKSDELSKVMNSRTKIVIPVHYGGMSCDMKNIHKVVSGKNVVIIEDACHALGSEYNDKKVGSCEFSDMCVFSFHPVKAITSAEGGMITTNSKELYDKLIKLRSHGITKNKDFLLKKDEGAWYYEMQELGFNYRLTDVQCALGLSQLSRLGEFVEKRKAIAKRYDSAFSGLNKLKIITEFKSGTNSYHLYVINVGDKITRRGLFDYLLKNGINCQVHYIPVYAHPYYVKEGISDNCPSADKFYDGIISIPIFPDLTIEEQNKVISCIKQFFS